MKKECYEEEVQPYRITDYKPITILILNVSLKEQSSMVFIIDLAIELHESVKQIYVVCIDY